MKLVKSGNNIFNSQRVRRGGRESERKQIKANVYGSNPFASSNTRARIHAHSHTQTHTYTHLCVCMVELNFRQSIHYCSGFWAQSKMSKLTNLINATSNKWRDLILATNMALRWQTIQHHCNIIRTRAQTHLIQKKQQPKKQIVTNIFSHTQWYTVVNRYWQLIRIDVKNYIIPITSASVGV